MVLERETQEAFACDVLNNLKKLLQNLKENVLHTKYS